MGTIELGQVVGERWYHGNGISGTIFIGTIFPNSGVEYAREGDQYLCTAEGESRGNIYICISGGLASEAVWMLENNIKGDAFAVVNDLVTNDSTKALSAAMGKQLNEMIADFNIYPHQVITDVRAVANSLVLEIDNKDTEITITDFSDNEAVYHYVASGSLETALITITLGTEIGLPQEGSNVYSVASNYASIHYLSLLDAGGSTIYESEPNIWETATTIESKITPDEIIQDGEEGVEHKTARITTREDGASEETFPITHAKAVWWSEEENTTLYEHLFDSFTEVETENNEQIDKLDELENRYDQLLAEFNATAFKVNWSEEKLQYETINVSSSAQETFGTASIAGTLHKYGKLVTGSFTINANLNETFKTIKFENLFPDGWWPGPVTFRKEEIKRTVYGKVAGTNLAHGYMFRTYIYENAAEFFIYHNSLLNTDIRWQFTMSYIARNRS